MQAKIHITGMGIISAIGEGAAASRAALAAGKSGLRKSEFLESRYAGLFHFGEVRKSNAEMIEDLNLQHVKGITRTELLAETAFRECVKSGGLSEAEIADPSTAFISASTVGGMSRTKELYHDAKGYDPPSEYLESYHCGAHALEIVKRYKMKGLNSSINTACSSSANAVMLGCRLINSGRAKRVIVGGADALATFTVNGFNSLHILSEELCKPFDAERKGLNLGEAAAFLLLEAAECSEGKEILGVVSGYGNTNDAYHPSSLSPDSKGIVLAISRALESAGLDAEAIDYINTHGTGTENNDYAELYGFKEIFGEKVPPFHSTKCYTGHTLAAAGSVEAVISLLAMKHSEIYPGLHFQKAIEPFELKPELSYKEGINIDHLLSNSFGFAGSCTSLIISKYKD